MGERVPLVHENFPHLSDEEWYAVNRMVEATGPDPVGSMLTMLSEAAQHASLFAFCQREAAEARRHADEARQQSAELQQQLMELLNRPPPQPVVVEVERQAPTTSRVETLKFDVAKYSGSEKESLLRWLVELEASINARGIANPAMQVAYAMSCLAGRAKTWAFGRRLADPQSFPSYGHFRAALKDAFEPPKSEFRARAEFLELKQGKRDIHAYTQHARYLVSCIVLNPVDDQTQVVTFMKGLSDGPIKTQLFREYPETMEEAVSLAIQEDFSLNQAYVHSSSYRAPKVHGTSDTTEAMDLSAIGGARERLPKSKQQCNRCKKTGHFAYECLAARPVSGQAPPRTEARKLPYKNGPRGGDRSKNGNNQ